MMSCLSRLPGENSSVPNVTDEFVLALQVRHLHADLRCVAPERLRSSLSLLYPNRNSFDEALPNLAEHLKGARDVVVFRRSTSSTLGGTRCSAFRPPS